MTGGQPARMAGRARPRRRRRTGLARAATPGDWLLARFDATNREELLREGAGTVCIRPIFELMSALSASGEPVRITQPDYADPAGQWL